MATRVESARVAVEEHCVRTCGGAELVGDLPARHINDGWEIEEVVDPDVTVTRIVWRDSVVAKVDRQPTVAVDVVLGNA